MNRQHARPWTTRRHDYSELDRLDPWCRLCGHPEESPIHEPRMGLRRVLEAALFVVVLFLLVAAASIGFAPVPA